MASSSVSQESLDMDDLDTTARRNRIRIHRGHGGRGSLPHRGLPFGDGGDQDRDAKDYQNGDVGDGDGGLGMSSHSHLPGDHESPTRGAAARLKDKRSRPNHVKGKLPKDKRKLREKRRSTGVVHCIPSTESTGDSLDDDDDDEDAVHDTKKNTVHNEEPAPGYQHQVAAHEGRHTSNTSYSHQRRNKSPSDLEADLEDNQDYDSTVSHSETNLTLIGRSESSEMSQNLPGKQAGSTGGMDAKPGSRGFSSKSHAFKFSTGSVSSDADSSRTNTSTSSSSSLISRYRDAEPAIVGTTNTNGAAASESDPGRKFNTNTDYKQNSQIQSRPLGFSVFNNSIVSGQRGDRPSYTSYVSSASKFRDRDGGSSSGTSSSFHARLVGAPRPFTSSVSSSAPVHQQNETITQLEKQIEKEKQENVKLQQSVQEKDKKIAELEKEIELLNKECDDLDSDNIQLQEENKALIRAMSKLTSNV